MMNLKFKQIVIVALLTLFTFNQVAFGLTWESLVNVNIGGAKIKIELQKSSVKKQLENKNKVLTFNLHHYVDDNKTTIDAYGTYKVNCNTREAWKLSSSFKIIDKASKGNSGEVKSQTPEKLKDKEYNDFQQTIDIMCQKY